MYPTGWSLSVVSLSEAIGKIKDKFTLLICLGNSGNFLFDRIEKDRVDIPQSWVFMILISVAAPLSSLVLPA